MIFIFSYSLSANICDDFLLGKKPINLESDQANFYASKNQEKFESILKEGKTFSYQKIGSPELVTGKFIGSELSTNGRQIYKFQIGDEILEIEKSKIFGIRKPIYYDQFMNKINHVIMTPIQANKLRRLMTFPYKPIAKIDELEIVGTWFTKKKLGKKVAEQITEFDEQMLSLGFLKPDKSRIIIRDKVILPTFMGPFSLNTPTYNLWSREFKTIISMEPVNWRSTVKESVIKHERMHALLHRTYSNESFINKSNTFQEAIADFAAAHNTGSPKIGFRNNSGDGVERDILNRTSKVNDAVEYRSDFMSITGDGYHEDSLLVSHFLWKMREKMGAEELSRVFKPLIDDLNAHYKNYIKLSGSEAVSAPAQKFIYEMEYFLSIVKKKSIEQEELKNIAPLIDDYIDELGLSKNKIYEYAHSLQHEGHVYKYDGKGKKSEAIFAMIYAGGSLAVEAWIIYDLFLDDK